MQFSAVDRTMSSVNESCSLTSQSLAQRQTRPPREDSEENLSSSLQDDSYAGVTATPSTVSSRSTMSAMPGFIHKYSIRSSSGADLRRLGIFKVDDALRRLIGSYTKLDHSADKSITVTIATEAQAKSLLQLRSLLNEPVTVDVHPSCKQSVGLIHSALLAHESTEDILLRLSAQHVTKVIRVKNNGHTYRVTFSVPSPPLTLTLCTGQTVSVRKAYPLPLRCYTCQHYGHSHTSCHSKRPICDRCGQPTSDDHVPKTCNKPEHCYHCKAPHATSSPNCPKYLAEKRILLLHHRDGVPMGEARQKTITDTISSGPVQSSPSLSHAHPSSNQPSVAQETVSGGPILHTPPPATGNNSYITTPGQYNIAHPPPSRKRSPSRQRKRASTSPSLAENNQQTKKRHDGKEQASKSSDTKSQNLTFAPVSSHSGTHTDLLTANRFSALMDCDPFMSDKSDTPTSTLTPSPQHSSLCSSATSKPLPTSQPARKHSISPHRAPPATDARPSSGAPEQRRRSGSSRKSRSPNKPLNPISVVVSAGQSSSSRNK